METIAVSTNKKKYFGKLCMRLIVAQKSKESEKGGDPMDLI